ncbi:MAG TPA: S8 family serine peptidase [Thermomicrobiales bacterium]|nr:S8 family serine peptidase [Thermomicrobiales bacterium]
MQVAGPGIGRLSRARISAALVVAIVLSLSLGTLPVRAASVPRSGPHQLIVTFRSSSPYWAPYETAEGLALDAVARADHGLRGQRDLAERRDLSLLTYADAASASRAMETLRRNPDVLAAEPNVERQLAWVPDDDAYSEQSWWLDLINAPDGWNINTGSDDTIVAVIDSGVSPTHPDLSGRLVPGYNVVDGTTDTSDIAGHGTHVAGIIAAQQNGIGTVGVAMGVHIMPIRVVDGAGDIDVSNEIEAIYWAVDNGADVINLSLGAEEYVQAEREAIQYAYNRGVVVVAAAGNYFNKVSYPGNYDEVIAAGSLKADGYPAPFTSRITRVDVSAPGERIYSPGWDDFFGDYWDDVFYADNSPVSGTSFSSAIVAGVVALLKSIDPTAGTEQVRSLLKSTATDTGGIGVAEAGAGAGEVNVEAALRASLDLELNETWHRADEPVASGAVSRTWLWGQEASETLYEPYDETQHGTRLVAYYDKSRMEITDPMEDRTQQWYVTNGLLVVEMITGNLQLGDDHFVSHGASNVNIAGDPDDTSGPTYAAFAGLLNLPTVMQDQTLILTVDRTGRVNANSHLATYGVTGDQYVPETKHRIANVFWDYLNSVGPIANGSDLTDGQLFDPWFYATGYPITEAYWARVKVRGIIQDVLIQCFERRCLTYTPANAEGWKVEMGNVGLHYYDWRYNSSATLDPNLTIRVPATANPGPRQSLRQLWRTGFN